MCRGSVVLLCLSIILVTVEKIETFAEDYYFRSHLDCDTDDFNFACSAKCKTQYTCMFGRCFCLIDPQDKGLNKFDLKHNNVMFYKKTVERSKLKDKDDDSSDESDSEYDYDRTYSKDDLALRHHIAHFCEDLDTARVCIKKCMMQGKPAFCGKDHTCYCGHRYPLSQASNKPVNVDNMHLAFQDLYAKYFGVTEGTAIHLPDIHSSEEEESEENENTKH